MDDWCYLLIILICFFKFWLNHDDDNHIFEFVKSKLGFADESNFESRLYLCLPAFQAIDLSVYVRLSYSLLLPLYLVYVSSRAFFITSTVFRKWATAGKVDEAAMRKKDDDYGQVRYFQKSNWLCYVVNQLRVCKTENWKNLIWNSQHVCEQICNCNLRKCKKLD